MVNYQLCKGDENKMRKKVELLVPAGNLEKLKIAIGYGADAVYIGGFKFSLRARASNFSLEDISQGVAFAHLNHAKVYVTTNIVPHTEDFEQLEQYLLQLSLCGVDGIITSCLSIIEIAKKVAPSLEIHLSTQASVANTKAIEMYKKLGIKRVVLAREVSFNNIKKIAENTDTEIEVFIHGGMCVSYSGRCMLSNHMTNRDANRGGCAHSCRWNYDLYCDQAKINERYYLNMGSKDLCAVDYIHRLIDCGVSSLKIEGRMKSLYYIATVTRSYRAIIDDYYNEKKPYQSFDPLTEIQKAENRFFADGFLSGKMSLEGQLYNCRSEMPTKDYVGIVLAYDDTKKEALIEQRNYFSTGDALEFFGSKLANTRYVVAEMYDEDGELLEVARHPLQKIRLKIPFALSRGDMLRKV